MNPLASPMQRMSDAVARVVATVGVRAVDTLDDEALVHLLRDAADARNALDVVLASASAVVDRPSARALGQAGLAQREGHRNGTSLLQSLTGQSRADVGRAVRAGEDLVPLPPAPVTVDAARESDASSEPRWRKLLRDALVSGRISQAQFQAIRGGLGEPPVERYPDLDPDFLPAAWAVAVERLLDEAAERPVEALRADAQIARDRLDPVGMTQRFEERFAGRSFRMWVDDLGQRHARIAFDDDAAAWVDAILQAALRPRRGPRFVDSSGGPESAADRASEDDRTNDQLSYDTVMAVLRAGAAADPTQAFGDRQPGVRIVVEAGAVRTEVDASTGADITTITGVGHVEDGGQSLPGGVVESYLCDAGSLAVTVDDHGRPLDVGRERRLFTRAQRIGITVREGGCIGIGCTAPPSQVEIHHIDHWSEHGGRTDIDDGVPLCRNHHLGLHNRGERITRRRDAGSAEDSYWLHSPPDPTTGELRAPRRLLSRNPRRFAAAV
jgi:hypothetical protein